MPHILVFSHLRWAFVYQRPQHLLSRIARNFPVIFVEESLYRGEGSSLAMSVPACGDQVLRPGTPSPTPGFHDEQLAAVAGLSGSEDCVDLIGVNHYHDSQWELPPEQPLEWNPPHPARRAFADLLQEAWRRCERRMLIAETSHVGEGRAAWLHMVGAEAASAMAAAAAARAAIRTPHDISRTA